MRPLLAIIGLVLVAIGLAYFASHVHPGGDLPPAEVARDEDRQKAEDAQKAQAKAQAEAIARVDHSPQAFDKVKEGAIRAKMEIEGRGTLTLEFYPKAAPKTVAHLVALMKNHFYDGIKFHRVETQGISVVQLGDPLSKDVAPDAFQQNQIGTHGSGTGMVPLEIDLPHMKNSIGMARAQAPNSGDSQFYFNVTDNTQLDGQYCVFGMVLEGADILPQIRVGDRIKSLTIQ